MRVVMKFGGTSVGSADAIRQVAEIVKESSRGHEVVVVVSAMNAPDLRTTDSLIAAAQAAAAGDGNAVAQLAPRLLDLHMRAAAELAGPTECAALEPQIRAMLDYMSDLSRAIAVLGELTPRALDLFSGLGERLNARLIAAALRSAGLRAEAVDATELIVTDERYGSAAPLEPETSERAASRLLPLLGAGVVPIVTGFIGATRAGVPTTLGRGGSDYTAAILAAALGAESLEIWTDVSGMMTADPRLVPNARPIARISYQEAMELSHFGAKVLYPPTIQPVMQRGIPLWIKNTFAPADYGTLVEVKPPGAGEVVRGISSISQLALLSLEGSGMVGIPGFSKRLFAVLARERINVILITQSSSEHSICVGVNEAHATVAQLAVDEEFAVEIAAGRIEPLRLETGLAIVALVGENMKNHPGISGKLFGALGQNGVNVRAIAQGSSEKNISTVIRAADVRKAINVVHEAFFEATYRQVNLFILGAGNVGGKLLEQLHRQRAYLQDKLRVQVRVVGLATSRHCAVNEEGLDLSSWPEALAAAPPLALADFTQLIIDKNLRNSVLVDVTANPEAIACYAPVLARSVAVVACNKVAASAEYAFYARLKSLSREFNAPFLFETNVGAALPIISTLQDIVRTGDVVRRIEAVLSGTLNFVFNNYDGTRPFAEVVRQAQTEGFTEPDPRLDLNGSDVARKILILAREAGETMEKGEVKIQGFLPPSCFEGDVEAFYAEMLSHEAHFQALYAEAAQAGKRLKFVAQYADGRATVGLQHLAPGHNLYDLRGNDNAILFYTNCYVDQPLVIKGAGAGGEVTAAGVFADIMRTVRV